ncbi:hypothetical protein C8R43DRAFT_1231038 [Mycena crocata]|nr:hypothetical protein C8R43DRAFT_1231038 [Mycena crocata]
MSESGLPLELERRIFETVALSDSESTPNFLLVAQRVKIWITPLLYRMIVFSRPLEDRICFEPSSFALAVQFQNISKYVEHIFWDASIADDFDSTLASCSAVHNLALERAEPSQLSFPYAMPLQRLAAIDLSELFSSEPLNLRHTLFAGITHLHLIDDLNNAIWDDRKDLALLPCLTHLAFLIDFRFRSSKPHLPPALSCRLLSSSAVPTGYAGPIGKDEFRWSPWQTIHDSWPWTTPRPT